MGVALFTSTRAKKIVFGQLLFAAAGIYFAARQLLLQSLPEDAVPSCLPGLDVLVKYFPWTDILHALFWGAGEREGASEGER